MKLYNHEEDNRDRTYEIRDNWLVAKEKYDYAYRIADEQDLKGVKLKTTPSLFYKEYWQSQVNYAEALVASGQDYLNEEHASAEQKAKENGITDTAERNAYIAEQVRKRLDSWGEQTHAAWMLADQDISDFAMNRKFPTVNKWLVALGQQEQLEQAKQQAVKELDQLVPGGAGSLFKQLDAKAQAADPGVVIYSKSPMKRVLKKITNESPLTKMPPQSRGKCWPILFPKNNVPKPNNWPMNCAPMKNKFAKFNCYVIR